MGASVFTFAQKKKSSPEESTPQSQTTTSAIDGKVAGMKKFAGFFDYYYDEKQDKTFLAIDKCPYLLKALRKSLPVFAPFSRTGFSFKDILLNTSGFKCSPIICLPNKLF